VASPTFARASAAEDTERRLAWSQPDIARAGINADGGGRWSGRWRRRFSEIDENGFIKNPDDERKTVGKTIMGAVVSADGYIADKGDNVDPLFDWYCNGDVEFGGHERARSRGSMVGEASTCSAATTRGTGTRSASGIARLPSWTCLLLSNSNIQRTGGLASTPGSCRRIPAEARTYRDGGSEMRVLSSTYGPRGDVELMVGLAVRLRALGAKFDTVAAEGCEALVETGVMPTGVWL
jgi:hypothetical protein